MQIADIRLYQLDIPFHDTFSHSSASRSKTETVWVEISTIDGISGYGEGCPRDYVTGETLHTAKTFFEEYVNNIISNIHSMNDLVDWVTHHRDAIDQNPAAWCAIELAVLDALGKTQQQTIEQLLGLPALSGTFRYSAVLGDSPYDRFTKTLQRYYAQGFRDFKVKLSGDITRDKQKFTEMKILNDKNIRVRVDANNLWQNTQEVTDYVRQLYFPTWAIEEPLVAKDYQALAAIGDNLNQRIILDESFVNQNDFINLGNSSRWIINLRISKMGGLIRSRDIAITAKHRNIPLIVGAQVGETSVLTRAGLTIANAFSRSVRAQEGAFGTWLLKADISQQPMMMGMDGTIKIPVAKRLSGLGLLIDLNNHTINLRILSEYHPHDHA